MLSGNRAIASARSNCLLSQPVWRRCSARNVRACSRSKHATVTVDGNDGYPHPEYQITGRHMDITPEIEGRVKDRLDPVIATLMQPQFLESEGGVETVEVRLMASQAHVTLRPRITAKDGARHDHTYFQRGHIQGLGQGASDAISNFELAVEQLEKKLHKWPKSNPIKKDQR